MNEKGTKISIWDVDTQSMHYLVFKFWSSSRSYVFIDNWTKDFVLRRGLKIGDEIGFHWDPYKNRFDFSILVRA
uniref:B3 domain-containing protein At2g33720 family n=2 Tax=Cajanus cajan TaxID=3821 RepID=A0A151RCS6_CAJCA|nr:B3 domain-containing protein At2g33720 family [Cajanus cajan]